METTKICTKCKIEKSIDEFTNSKNNKDGKSYQCRECNSIQNKEYREKNKDNIKDYKKEMYEKNRENVLQQRKEYYEKNRDMVLDRVNKYTDINREEINEKRRQFRKDNIEHMQNQDRKKYVKFREQILLDRKAYNKTENGRLIKLKNDGKRRAKLKNGDVTVQQLKELERNVKVCYWCNEPLKNKEVHIDHYIPLSKGGEHTISNLVIACSKCNHTKSAKDPLVFAQSLGRLL